MFSALYQIFITPLVQLTEFFYSLFFEVTGNQGIAVIGLSFIVTIFTLPLYMVAEQWQETERNIQKKLKPGVERIKSTFKGDEQYMVLSTFYRENHYHPIYALRSSFSLLIQIPFFIAAYNFLSNLEPLKNYSFLFIKSFGEPDATFHIGSFAVNVLPVAMTIINCVAGLIYSKGHPLSEKIQIYACAAVFLLLLYNSPAGLVVYWTMNNVLSLVKNIFYKIRNPKKVLYIIACIVSICLILCGTVFFRHTKLIFRIMLVFTGILIPLAPFAAKFLGSFFESHFYILDENPKLRLSVFLISAFILAVLTGLAIPSILMQSEPEQYSYVDSYTSPLYFIWHTFFQSLGFFVVWPFCFYALFSSKTKKVLTFLFTFVAFSALLNCFAFSGNYGPVNPNLLFMTPQHFMPGIKIVLVNILCMAVILSLVAVAFSFKAKVLNSLCTIFLISLVAISGKNIISVQTSFRKMEAPDFSRKIEPIFHLSKKGKNVIILMQDRFFSPLIPKILENNPELRKRLDGFIWYPNTVSFGKLTMIGTPGIFGGYDYTPFEMNRRTDKTLQQKHNEAILTMPIVFNQNNWNVTVADLPYENYLEQPVTYMYKGYDFINRITTHGAYSNIWYARNNMKKSPFMSEGIKRNFIWFSVLKIVPPFMRQIIYHKKYWISYNKFEDNAKFIDNYSEIDLFPELFDSSSEKNAFFLLDNEANHESILLQAPDYIPVENVTDFGPGGKDETYSSMVGVLKRFADFIDFLKENNLYDNTKIILVSDHGMSRDTGVFDNKTQNFPFYKENMTATLLVKDFFSRGNLKEVYTFMTNADTPALALKDIDGKAVNPFTKNPLDVNSVGGGITKNDFIKMSNAPAESTRIRKNTRFNIKDDEWYTVKDNIFDDKNWSHYIVRSNVEF
ncbi:membrane protein insertase YidC [uncultured Treponema sp.]|uniref:membrane protein insertase YidC n=1 Tax=uncultured Treponema sp. TaxID=162155 RepID=UPI002623D6E6|nr:membrane protein insertase YidC [uncultured Treponema sp.]